MGTWDDLPEHLKTTNNWSSIDKKQLVAAHDRCVKAGVDPALDVVGDVLTGSDLRAFLSHHTETILGARRLFSILVDSVQDKACAFVLTDAEARIIELFAAPEVLAMCVAHGAGPGGSLSDESCGTNAVSLALHHKKPVILRGGQHFTHLFHDWLSLSAPIINSEDEQIGCANLAMDHKKEINQSLALIKEVAVALSHIMDKKSLSPSEDMDNRKLSKRQNEILGGLLEGDTSKEIGVALGIVPSTVETHLSQMKKKYGVKTTCQLAVKIGHLYIPTMGKTSSIN